MELRALFQKKQLGFGEGGYEQVASCWILLGRSLPFTLQVLISERD